MDAVDWKNVHSLYPLEKHNWGDRNQIDRRVIHTLDDLARSLSTEVLITCGTTGAHVQGSYHYPGDGKLGLALDFMLPGISRRKLPDVLFEVLRFGFTGIGIYSEWKLGQGRPSIGGFHVDYRPVGRRALWLKGLNGYEALTQDNLRRYFY